MPRARQSGAQVRHALEKKILAHYEIHSQEDLMNHLRAAGHPATQATISRDLAALGVQRTHTPEGRTRYVLPTDPRAVAIQHERTVQEAGDELRQLGTAFVIDCFRSLNFLTLHCPSGAANYVAAAIDRLGFEEIKGTIAGDDTILIIAVDEMAARKIERDLL